MPASNDKPQNPQKDLGWAKITHPFHPLYGQRFKILKLKKVTEGDILTLQGTHRGWFFVPREWTDKADPSIETCPQVTPSVLSFVHLLSLSDLLDQLKKGKKEDNGELDK